MKKQAGKELIGMNDFLTSLTAAVTADSVNILTILLSLAVSGISGIIIGITYYKTNSSENVQRNFVLTLFMLPVIMSMIILFVGSNIARAFSLAGTVSIIRFRSAPGDPKDIGYIFFSVAAGLACGISFYAYGLVFVIMLCIILAVLERSKFACIKAPVRMLKITIPEDLNYTDAFSDIFERFTSKNSLNGIRTADLGSVFILTYHIIMADGASEKEMIDELRCRNGNLTISISEIPVIAK